MSRILADMNRTRICLSSLAALAGAVVCLNAAAQDAAYPPPLGTKTLYVPGKDTNAAVPMGYSPFFISSVGRHGARHVTNLNELNRLDHFLQEMANAGGLTSDGLRLRGMISTILDVEKKYTPRAGIFSDEFFVYRRCGRH
jgi:hypothetical protein